MGQHILPQFYLRGFASPAESEVWTYEKGKDCPRLLPIKNVAQGRRLYGDIEGFLTKDIEGPAIDALRKIRNQEKVPDSLKQVLSKYVYVFAKRVPAAFKRFKDKAPEIAREEMKKIDGRLREYEEENPGKADRCSQIRKDAQRIINDLAQNPSREIWANSIQYGNKDIPGWLSGMMWTFYVCAPPDIFITSDNPVFIHRAIGIGKQHSDLSFPVSKSVSLLASRQNRRDLQFQEATPQQIKELNRRTAFNAMRFAYGPVDRGWIADLLNKPKHEIHLWVQQFPDKRPRRGRVL